MDKVTPLGPAVTLAPKARITAEPARTCRTAVPYRRPTTRRACTQARHLRHQRRGDAGPVGVPDWARGGIDAYDQLMVSRYILQRV